MRIMIIDDNAAMRKVLAALFASVGHEVVESFADGNGVEAQIRELAPELVCLDCRGAMACPSSRPSRPRRRPSMSSS